jgi:hypothetical protein
VRALMVEVKESSRAVAGGKFKGRQAAGRGAHGKFAARSGKPGGKAVGRSVGKSAGSAKAVKSTSAKSKSRSRLAAKPPKPQTAATKSVKPPLNLSKANSKPTRKVTGKGRASDS